MNIPELIQEALTAREEAYAPYSDFMVGAALLVADGTVYTGCNIENVAFTPTNCAERTAFFQAVKEGKRDFCAIAVVGALREAEMPFDPCFPCGVCLQVMLEFCDPDSFEVIIAVHKEQYTVYKLKDLIPYGFVNQNR